MKLFKNLSILIIVSLLLFYFSENLFNKKNSVTLISNTTFNDIPKNPLQIKILNGCGEKGLADLYKNYLRDKGFDVIDYKNADHFNYNKTQASLHNDNVLIGDIVDILGIDTSNIDFIYNKNIFYDLTLIIGADYKNLDSYKEVIKYYNPFE